MRNLRVQKISILLFCVDVIWLCVKCVVWKCLRHIERLHRMQLRMIEEMYMGKSTEWSRQELSPHLRIDFADIHLQMHIQHLNHVDHIFSSKHNSFSLCGILFSNCVILCFCNVCVCFFHFLCYYYDYSCFLFLCVFLSVCVYTKHLSFAICNTENVSMFLFLLLTLAKRANEHYGWGTVYT